MIRYDGMRMTWNGTIIVARNTRNSTSRPGKRSRANAYAASDESKTCPSTIPAVITIELK